MGGKLFQPTPSEENPGHYLTFIESDTKFRNNPQDIPPIDSQQPSMKDDTLGICTLGGCKGYKFLSSANESRHIRLAHGGRRGRHGRDN